MNMVYTIWELASGIAAYTKISSLTLSRTKALVRPTTQTCDDLVNLGHNLLHTLTHSPRQLRFPCQISSFRPNSNMAKLEDYIAEAFKIVHATLQLAHGSEQRTLST